MKKIVYLILHYRAVADTTECIESILRLKKENIIQKIVVVDNGSADGSYEKLLQIFKENNDVVILHSQYNLGFAKGNNIGFQYAKKNLGADFIVQLNNDTLIQQENFNEIIISKFNDNHYWILGPDIVTADGYHQNPVLDRKWTIKKLRQERLKKRIRILLFFLHLDRIVLHLQKSKNEIYQKTKLEQDIKDTMLHGACLIFSRYYIQQFDGMDSRTFLYMEEDILRLYANHYNYLMMYSGDLEIYHKEDISTKKAIPDQRSRMIQHDKNIINSSKVYERIKKELANASKTE